MSSNHIIDPVERVIKAFQRGIVATQTISRNASTSPIPDALEPAQALQKSLAESESLIKDRYSQSVKALDQRYSEAILNDSQSSLIPGLSLLANISKQVLPPTPFKASQ